MLAGGGGVEGTYGPMAAFSSRLSAQAQSWAGEFAAALGSCGNPALDGVITSFGTQVHLAATELSGSSCSTANFVTTCSGNFANADGGAG